MEKNKGLFSFRKHPVGDFPDGKKGRKRKGGRLRRSMGFLMAAVLIFNTLPASGLAVSASEQEKGLCEHHPEHTSDCGYREAQPCTHEHTEECYKTVTECVHEHTDECYPETEATEESTGEGSATTSDAGNREPSLCTHVCSEESGCITKVLDCHHEHDESCGYKEAQDCGYVCEICNGTELEDTENNAENDAENAGTDTAECICETLCTEDSINGDCPVCGADDASFLDCKGKVPEENTENQEDTGICKHHQEHDADCGYIPKSEDGEGSPCTYECRICPIEDLIAALPNKVTEDNEEEVRAQLDEILALYRELTEDEQGQLDLSRIYALQEALDAANAPMAAAETINVTNATNVTLTAEDGGCQGHTFTGKAQRAGIYVKSGAHDVTFSGLNITGSANVGIAPGATMNLTIEGTNTIRAGNNFVGIYVPADAALVIQGAGSLDVSGSGSAGIGGAVYALDGYSLAGDPNCGTVEIKGGTVTATGGRMCAGIGGGVSDDYSPGNGGTVTISGGTVSATGGSDSGGNYGGAGIGGSAGESTAGSGGSLTISGGHVTLTAGNSTSYGFGQGTGKAPGGTCELTLADVNYLDSGTTLDPKGKYTINGDPTADMIVVPELVYTGEVLDTSGIKIDDSKTGTGTYFGQTFTVNASKDGWVLQDLGEVVEAGEYTAVFKKGDKEISKTFTVAKSDTDLKTEGKVLTYNGDIQTTTFNADDTITVKATPVATGTAPAKAAARLRGSYTAPTAGQMALFVGDVQVSAPVEAGTDGTYTMEVSAADVLLQGNAEQNGNAVTLTAKFVGNDNMADAAGTVDVRISAVAKAELDGKVIGYYGESNLDKAFANDGATVTLLDNITTSMHIGVDTGNLTLDLNGKTITKPASYGLYVSGSGHLTIRGNGKVICTGTSGSYPEAITSVGGTLTLEGGTFIGLMYGVRVDWETSVLSVTGESVSIQGERYGLRVAPAQSVQLSAGTYSSISVGSSNTLAGLLAENCAYYKGSTPILLSELEEQKELAGPVTVRECQHTGVEVKDLGDGKHGLTCPYCGYHSEHTTTPTATASGNTVTLNGGCNTEGCGYTHTLGSIKFTFPKVTYGQTEQTVTLTGIPADCFIVCQVEGGMECRNADGDTEMSITLAQLFGSAKVTAGEHKMKVSFVNATNMRSNACELNFTVDPAPLTADMVTLGQTDDTYNGTEQKPALTVKQGETTLTGGTDYEVSYKRGDAATTDFTNAGTVKITVTGKGNYGGEVEKTFTIKQAESDVGTVTAETLENTLDVSQVVLSRTNQTPAGTLTLTDSALKYGANTYTWKFTPDDTVNYKAATGTVQVTVNDTIAPSAEYRLGTDGWKKFVNTVTFGLFCKDFKTVDIRGTDDTDAVTGSGIASTQYYISDQEITDTDSIGWETYTEPISLDALGKYFIYVKVTDNVGNTAVLNSEGIVVYAESTVSPAVFDYTYKENRDCTIQLAMNGNTFKGFTDREGNAVGTNDYTIDGDGRLILKAAYLDTLDQGEYAYTVSVNPQGIETDQVTLAYTFTVNVKARELTVTGAAAAGRDYDGTNKVEVTAVTLSGIVGSDTVEVDVSGIQGTLNSANAGRYTSVTLPQLTLTGADSGNYILVQPQAAVPTSVTITPLSAVITVGTDTYRKTFGDAAFTLDVTDNNAEADVQYEVTKGTDVVSVENGTVTILKAGPAEIRVSLPASTNYNAAENKTITVTVAKASAPSVETELKQYIKTKGSGGEAAAVDVAGKLPADRGETTYEPVSSDDSSILSDVTVDQNGKLTYKVGAGEAGSTASIQVTAKMENYANAVFTLKINLVDVIQVKIKAEAENAVYDGSPQKGYADGITCDYPVAGYAFAYKGREDTAYDSSEPPVDAGSYSVTVSVSDQSRDYEGSVSLAFIIEKASITIKADDKTAEKGSPVPELTYTASGLAEKDMLAAAPKLACDADMGTEGSYPITVSGAKAPDTKNYYEEITYENGMLTVQDSAVHVTGVSLDKSTLSLSEGGTGQLAAVISPENATDRRVSWTSGNTAAASVDSSGKVTAVREGTAVITVTTADGGYTASCTVTVTKDRGSGSTGGGSGSTGGGSGSFGGGGSGSTGGSSGSGGSGSTGGSTDTKQPFIKDSSGREGWDVIRTEAETAAAAPAGGTVAVDMNGAVSVPGSIFAAVRGKDVTLSFDMGSGVTWSVNGKDVTAEAVGDTDFSVTADAGAIPKELLAETAGGLAHLEISLAHEGAFGFTATLTLRITGRDGNGTATGSSGAAAEYTGMYANLFYYNPDLRSLEFVCAGQIREDGTADLPFVHASDYTVILSVAPMGGTGTPEEPEKPAEPAAEAKVKSVKLSKTLYTYDGKLKKPAVLAMDTEGRRISARYYTVSYKNNRKAGRATATVKFKGGYSGTVKKTFTIRPAGTSIRKLTAVSGGFTVKWKKKTVQTGGYQIQYSADAGFQGSSTHSVFVKKNTAVKKTVKNLKAGKKYYVRIRTYQTVKEDGKNIRIYSAWSRAARVAAFPVSRKKTASSSRDRAFLMVEKEDGKKRAA